MFFDVDTDLDELRYLILMFALEASEQPTYTTVKTFRQEIAASVGVNIQRDDLLSLYHLDLIKLWNQNDQELPTQLNATDDGLIELSLKGMAVLVNASNKYLDVVVTRYDVPDGVTATLIPHLDITRVPAADRYVSTADNQELFSELAGELENIKNELVRDQNAGELPIPAQTKRAMAVELEGLVGQIRAGFVRISDLTTRARPLLKSIADTCKDIGVIGGMAYAAYEVIGKLLGAIF
jgi:hypothetical protein